jgi:hypothetical protein
MSFLNGLLGNKVVVNAMLGNLKGIIREQNLDCIVVKLDPDSGDLLIGLYKPGDIEIKVLETAENAPEIVNPETLPANADNKDN